MKYKYTTRFHKLQQILGKQLLRNVAVIIRQLVGTFKVLGKLFLISKIFLGKSGNLCSRDHWNVIG